jgi:para-nitrobenzyl esterase
VRGTAEDDIVSWTGVPFAVPPIGPRRWRAPQPVNPWNSILDAAAYRSDCMQKPFPSDAAPLGTPPAEDCLYANVWRPKAGGRKLPVAVWIYGGGFVTGGSSPLTYAGAELVRRGVVFVSSNYRVGRFGTFAHPALTRENADKGLLGNYGYMDQLAALQWVQRNARSFGGDPGNVTIIDESAGGMSVINWLTSPLGKGLFNKAVVMSRRRRRFPGRKQRAAQAGSDRHSRRPVQRHGGRPYAGSYPPSRAQRGRGDRRTEHGCTRKAGAADLFLALRGWEAGR